MKCPLAEQTWWQGVVAHRAWQGRNGNTCFRFFPYSYWSQKDNRTKGAAFPSRFIGPGRTGAAPFQFYVSGFSMEDRFPGGCRGRSSLQNGGISIRPALYTGQRNSAWSSRIEESGQTHACVRRGTWGRKAPAYVPPSAVRLLNRLPFPV